MFKKNDKVRCINNNGSELILGNIYTCIRDSDSYTYVAGYWYGYNHERFELVESEKMNLPLQIDTINKTIYKSVLEFLGRRGFDLYNLPDGFYQFIKITDSDVTGNYSKKTDCKDISINELFEMEFTKPITINGHKVVKTSDGIKIGCTTVTMEQIEEIYKFAKS